MTKKTKIVIFGLGKMGQLAHFYFTHDSPYEVVSFSADAAFIEDKQFNGLPVVPFEEIQNYYKPGDYKMFVAVGYKRLNKLREEKYLQAKDKGYSLVSYFSSKLIHWGDAVIGDNCFILENQVIQPYVSFGNNTFIWSGNHFGHNVTIGDHCWLSSHIVCSGGVKIGNHSFIGVNAAIRDDVTIGNECIIGAGSLILNDVADKQVFVAKQTDLYPLDSTRFERMMEISRR